MISSAMIPFRQYVLNREVVKPGLAFSAEKRLQHLYSVRRLHRPRIFAGLINCWRH